MAAGNVSRTMRAPGRIVVNPTTAFATTAYPYGGTEVGRSNLAVLRAFGRPFRVESEALGEATDILEPNLHYVFSFFLRGWDDDAVEQFLATGYAAGGTSKHSVFAAPSNVPGTSAIGRAVILAYVPDDVLHVNGLLIYRGIPDWSDGAEIAFQRGSELGIPLSVDCLRNGSGNTLKVGRLADISL